MNETIPWERSPDAATTYLLLLHYLSVVRNRPYVVAQVGAESGKNCRCLASSSIYIYIYEQFGPLLFTSILRYAEQSFDLFLPVVDNFYDFCLVRLL